MEILISKYELQADLMREYGLTEMRINPRDNKKKRGGEKAEKVLFFKIINCH